MSARRGGLFAIIALLALKMATDVYLHSRMNDVPLHDVALRRSFQQRPRTAQPPSRTAKPRNTSDFAYAFVIGGCNPENGLYRGFLYNAMVASEILREEGSTSDVVVVIQMSYNTTAVKLPKRETTALDKLGIAIKYLDKTPHESFYDTVLSKFRILAFTEYRRILLLDGDIMPLGNLDYFFHMSMEGKLKENMIVSGAIEPANGGLFVLAPGEGEYERLQAIIHRREVAAQSMAPEDGYRGYRFDPIRGWGHVIEPPDQWAARRESGRNWTFHFAFSDQGLLYHWTKYEKKSVSIVFENYVENWSALDNGTVYMESRLDKPFTNYSKPRLRVYIMCHKFICDVMHFTGSKKPWLRRPPGDLSLDSKDSDPLHIWWWTLQTIDKRIGMKLDYENWKRWQEPPLGNYATLKDMEKHAQVNTQSTYGRSPAATAGAPIRKPSLLGARTAWQHANRRP